MRKRIIPVLAALLTLLSLSACRKEGQYSRRPGDVIVFAAPGSSQPVTKGPNAPATKAAYESGTEKGNIYWEAEDVIRIWCNQAHLADDTGNKYADYVLTPRSADPTWSDINCYQGGNGLYWGNASHTFYAVYPSPVMGRANGPALNNSQLTLHIPSAQAPADRSVEVNTTTFTPDMTYVPLVASTQATVTGGDAPPVSLNFKAQFTAFEFVVKADESGDLNLTTFEFSSTSDNLAATTATATISGTGENVTTGSYSYTDPDPVQQITFTLGTAENPFVLQAGKMMVFTVFALAADNLSGCSIRFNTPSGYRSLALKYDEDYFAAHPELVTEKRADAKGYLIFPKGKKITLMGFNVPGKFYIAFNDITIGGHAYDAPEAGDYWERRLQEMEWEQAVIGGHVVEGQNADSEWGLITYDLTWEKFVIGGQEVASQNADSAWKPILSPLPDPIGSFTAGGQGYGSATLPDPTTTDNLTVNVD